MDPASAPVASVGFAGSIATLAATVVNSYRFLSNIYVSFKDAPEDIHRLLRKLQKLENIISEIRKTGDNIDQDAALDGSYQTWAEDLSEMENDLNTFKHKVSKVEAIVSTKAFSRKGASSRVRKFVSKDEITKYEGILSNHVETFSLILSLLSKCEQQARTPESLRTDDALVPECRPFSRN
ncbi:hypothetical protein OEA41_008670 [Lepraria neglecta]|uniref:Fungal N-terminal domain-containing protein n=1 Tax=Lepraria neglecta TaxID=209136 RepID=A0AAE0DG12_9LECA|nr:hypothetical protein OEA41_008670 [Lepraria neglecta]